MSDSTKPEPENKKQIIKDPVIEPDIALRTRSLPIIITLLGAGIACVISVVQFTDFNVFFARLIKAVVLFGIIGIIVKLVLDLIFNKKNKSEISEESSKGEETKEDLQENREIEPDEAVSGEDEPPEESDE